VPEVIAINGASVGRSVENFGASKTEGVTSVSSTCPARDCTTLLAPEVAYSISEELQTAIYAFI